MDIAGGQWRYHTPNGLALQAPGGAYAEFVSAANEADNSNLDSTATEIFADVELTLEPPPPVADLKRLFDTGRTWWMAERGDERVLVLDPAGPADGPLWVAVTDAQMSIARVHCHPILVDHASATPTLRQVAQYPLDQLLLIHRLCTAQGVLVHTAALETNGEAVLLAGHSGAGKSTAAALLSTEGQFRPFGDDRVVLRLQGQQLMAYGTPWPGEGGIASNRALPVKAIGFLQQSEATHITPLRPRDALPALLEVSSVPWYAPELRDSLLNFLDWLLANTPCYTVEFARDGRALAKQLARL